MKLKTILSALLALNASAEINTCPCPPLPPYLVQPPTGAPLTATCIDDWRFIDEAKTQLALGINCVSNRTYVVAIRNTIDGPWINIIGYNAEQINEALARNRRESRSHVNRVYFYIDLGGVGGRDYPAFFQAFHN